MDLTQLSDTDIDPEGKYVLTTRVRTGRSIKGFKLPPLISFQERRDLEALCVKGLLNMGGDLKGDYFPLNGSHSYAPKPDGMSLEKEEELRSCGNLFQEPDSTLLLASGMGRHWPDGRGVFENEGKNLFVWVGEEDITPHPGGYSIWKSRISVKFAIPAHTNIKWRSPVGESSQHVGV